MIVFLMQNINCPGKYLILYESIINVMNISVEKRTDLISSTNSIRKEQRIITKLAKGRKLLSMHANENKKSRVSG